MYIYIPTTYFDISEQFEEDFYRDGFQKSFLTLLEDSQNEWFSHWISHQLFDFSNFDMYP